MPGIFIVRIYFAEKFVEKNILFVVSACFLLDLKIAPYNSGTMKAKERRLILAIIRNGLQIGPLLVSEYVSVA